MGFIWSHSASWFSLTEYFPAFCTKRALKVSAGVSLWRHLRWQTIIRYFYSTEMIFFSFPSLQGELWSATLSDSASHLPAFKTPQFSHLLTYFKKKFYCLWKKSDSVVLASSFLQQRYCCLQWNLCPSRHFRGSTDFIPGQQVQWDAADALWNELGKAVGPFPSASPVPGEKTESR